MPLLKQLRFQLQPVISLLLKLYLIILGDADLPLQLSLQLHLQVTHLLLVVFDEFNQLDHLCIGFFLSSSLLHLLDLLLEASDLLPQVLVLRSQDLLLGFVVALGVALVINHRVAVKFLLE